MPIQIHLRGSDQEKSWDPNVHCTHGRYTEGRAGKNEDAGLAYFWICGSTYCDGLTELEQGNFNRLRFQLLL